MTEHDDDLCVMSRWLSDPRVLEFYEGRDNPHDVEMIRHAFIRKTTEKGETPCIVELDRRPVGYLQFYPVDADGVVEYGLNASETVYGLDQFIGEPDLWGRGVGRAMIRLVLEHLFREQGAQRVVLDPVVENLRAIRCYEACGFRRAKLLPGHEMHEGRLRDCWLMEVTPEKAVLGEDAANADSR